MRVASKGKDSNYLPNYVFRALFFNKNNVFYVCWRLRALVFSDEAGEELPEPGGEALVSAVARLVGFWGEGEAAGGFVAFEDVAYLARGGGVGNDEVALVVEREAAAVEVGRADKYHRAVGHEHLAVVETSFIDPDARAVLHQSVGRVENDVGCDGYIAFARNHNLNVHAALARAAEGFAQVRTEREVGVDDLQGGVGAIDDLHEGVVDDASGTAWAAIDHADELATSRLRGVGRGKAEVARGFLAASVILLTMNVLLRYPVPKL